jgi:hypothetical protein
VNFWLGVGAGVGVVLLVLFVIFLRIMADALGGRHYR